MVGMSSRFPGCDRSVGSFWKLLTGMKSAICEIPYDRFDVDAVFDRAPDAFNKLYTCHGGFISSGVEYFAANAFGITRSEALMMDSQQRLLLEVGYETLYTAGETWETLIGSITGVFVGIYLCRTGAQSQKIN